MPIDRTSSRLPFILSGKRRGENSREFGMDFDGSPASAVSDEIRISSTRLSPFETESDGCRARTTIDEFSSAYSSNRHQASSLAHSTSYKFIQTFRSSNVHAIESGFSTIFAFDVSHPDASSFAVNARWDIALTHVWRRDEHINILEGESILLAVR